LWHATADLVLTSCSSAVSEMLGYSPAELIGRSMFDFIASPDVPRARAVLGQAMASGRGWTNVELHWNHRDGHSVAMQGSATPVLNSAGAVIGFRGARRYVAGDAEERRRLAEITHRLNDIVATGRIPVALQPIVDLATGGLYGVEALARFADNRAPDLWFGEAHAVGRGVELELIALRCALECLPALPEPVRLSVNASPALALDGRFRELLERQPVDRITVEITEHAAVALYDELRAALLPLRSRGLAVAVDDAGAGYASFTHVLQLRPDVIKLDRSWLHDIPNDAARRTLVTAIVLLALDLGAAVTAEGVEQLDQLAAITQLGVDHAQGYYFARPSTDPETWARWHGMTWAPSRWAELPQQTR
jgi:PAS domain S-box-containing protein